MITYKELPVTFQKCQELKKRGMVIREYLAVRDNGTPVDRFEIYRLDGIIETWTTWNGNTFSNELKTMRCNFCDQVNVEKATA